MADLRSYHLGVAIADNLATPSNDTLGVGSFLMNYDGANWDMVRGDATDGLQVNLGANNDVTVTSGAITADTELPVAAALTDDFANPTAPGVGAFLMLWDSATWDRAPGTTADGLLVNLGGNNDVVCTATALDIRALSEATDQVLAFANTVKDGSGTDYVPLVDADGHFQVDVLTGGGTDSPTTPATDYVTSAALAAGSSVNLDTSDIGTAELWAVQVWSSVAYKVEIYTVENATPSAEPLAIGGAPAHGAWEWQVPHRDFASVTTSAGADGFRAAITNLDDTNAADVYATFQYSAS